MAGRSGRKRSNLIGSLSGRNPAVRTGSSDRFFSISKKMFRNYNKHLIDRACSVNNLSLYIYILGFHSLLRE
jgi:hypothetical protein